ncbi:hypothetical protein [Sphingobacterium sp.]|uniref:hypothetical protein n=1 Tax=Sphingobacterium sp. TaxID=341027 RepID=UPI0025F231F1|nr:hypothetical protein [Sphingobacterium sp.]
MVGNIGLFWKERRGIGNFVRIINILTMEMKEPFDIELGDIVYSVFPEEEDTYVIFKDGTEYVKIIRDNDTNWLKLNPETELPMFGMDEEINLIGLEIKKELGH